MHVHDRLDLNGNALRKARDSDRRAGMATFVTEQLNKKVGTTIEDCWVIAKLWAGIYVPVYFKNALNSI